MNDLILSPNASQFPDSYRGLTFNLLMVLPGRTSSLHSQRAYFRWVDQYLVFTSGLSPTYNLTRLRRMEALPVDVLRLCLNAPQLRAWLGYLVQSGQGKQAVNQARAAVVTLGSLLAEAGLLDDSIAGAMRNVRLPNVASGQRPGRWLSKSQIQALMLTAKEMGTSDNQRMRNHLAVTMLCTMALRREELVAVKWGDLSLQNERLILRVHGKGRKVGLVDVPRPVAQAVMRWRQAVSASRTGPDAHTTLIRRIYKGGGISPGGLTTDGVWFIIHHAARAADIGVVAPHDLRRSVAGALHEAGVPIDKISRLLRHSNVAVTERYLSRLPQRNEAATLMSDLLGLEDDEEEWPGY